MCVEKEEAADKPMHHIGPLEVFSNEPRRLGRAPEDFTKSGEVRCRMVVDDGGELCCNAGGVDGWQLKEYGAFLPRPPFAHNCSCIHAHGGGQ